MPVLERVCASTVLTMTAQESAGPGVPSGNGLPGSEPGTTTEYPNWQLRLPVAAGDIADLPATARTAAIMRNNDRQEERR